MQLLNETWLIQVTKRKRLPDGSLDTFTGTTHNDGLQSLWHVHTSQYETRIASVLDRIEWLEWLR